MRRHLRHFRYLLLHKWYVFCECRKLKVPLWIAFWHDWDKFLPEQWFPYIRGFYGPDPALDGTLQNGFDAVRITRARMLHQRRNKHHWQYWVFIGDGGEIIPLPMPDVFRREMLADWRGASIAMGKPDLAGWYFSNRDNMHIYPETKHWLDDNIQR